MADERDEQTQSSQETAVGHSVVEDPGATQAREIPAGEAAGATAAGATPTPAPAEATEVFFSRDEAQQEPAVQGPPTPPQPSEEGKQGGSSPAEADRIASDQEDAFAEKPHVYVLGAFAGAFVLAQILKRITGGDD